MNLRRYIIDLILYGALIGLVHADVREIVPESRGTTFEFLPISGFSCELVMRVLGC